MPLNFEWKIQIQMQWLNERKRVNERKKITGVCDSKLDKTLRMKRNSNQINEMKSEIEPTERPLLIIQRKKRA